MAKVQADYDFEAEKGSTELSLTAGEILTVLRDNVEGGWIEGRNSAGKVGLFPQSYVSACTSGPPPPGPPPPLYPPIPSRDDDWGRTMDSFAPPPPAHPPATAASSVPSLPRYQAPPQDDFDDDEWTDEDEDDRQEPLSHSNNAVFPAATRSQSAGAGGVERTTSGKIKGNMNRFSNFVKSGMESYVISDGKISSQPGEKHEIVVKGGVIRWVAAGDRYSCVVDKPKKETKLKGLKSFIAYSLKSTISGIQVSRRYKHFDWLHDVLSNKFITIALPPLPEKQVAGRYEEDLIDHRKHILQLYVDSISRHPVLSSADVWLHFLTCTDEKQWKSGKRKAERDEYVGGAFFHAVTVPDAPLNLNDVERSVDQFCRHVKHMDDASRIISERVSTYQRLLCGPVKQNWQKMSVAFSALSSAFREDSTPASSRLSDGLQNVSHEYFRVGDDLEGHAKNDIEPLLERLFTFRGTVQRVPDISHIHKQAVSKFRNSEKAVLEGKASESEAVRVKQRVDTISYAVMAEITHLNEDKADDFRRFIGAYLRKQQEYYLNLSNVMGKLAEGFE